MSMDSLDGAICVGRHRMQIRAYYEDTDFSGIVDHASASWSVEPFLTQRSYLQHTARGGS